MGSPGSGAADCTVGSIVWVRRRNGSWWPGKILGPEELDVSHLTSPRSGTPVKLLGREDASVDWYNLEKSKRVKAFRCGDFDDCIERVESSQGMPIRKREKYARREDAILHALELERELLKKQGKTFPAGVRSNSTGSAKEELVTSGNLDVGNKFGFSNHLLRSNHVGNLIPRKVKDDDHPSGEDDHPEVAPRMRGLQDFGLRTASSKRKVTCSSGHEGSLKLTNENNSPVSSGDNISMGRSADMHGNGQIGGSVRTKKSRYNYGPAEFEASDFRGCPSNQMEMLHPSLGDADSHHTQSMIEEDTSEYMEDVESDSSDSDSDSSETEDDIDEEIALLSGVKHHTPTKHDAFGKHKMVEDESVSSEENDESSLSGGTPHLYSHDPAYINETVSKWQHKGKRNLRNLTKMSSNRADVRHFRGSVYGAYPDSGQPTFRRKSLVDRLGFHGIHHVDDEFDEGDLYEDFEFRRSNGGFTRSARSASRSQNNFSHSMLEWGEMPDGYNHNRMKRQLRDPRVLSHRRFGGNMRPMLIDVDLTVQGGYKKEPVPLVSLTSALDGRAIVGHPVPIESLPDGSSEASFRRRDILSNEATRHDRSLGPTPPWKTTSKRSNSRVPRLHPFSAIQADEAADDHDEGRKLPFKKSNLGIFNNDASWVRKRSLPHVPRPPTDRKSQKKPKKASLSASQKTRALSSIGMEQSHGLKPPHNSSNIQIDGFSNKQDSAGPPPVACIPVKLVFSRLLEKINRPASRPPPKAVLYNSGVRRDP